jgi:hypothetical protein
MASKKNKAKIRLMKRGPNKGKFYRVLVGKNGEPLDDYYDTKQAALKTTKSCFPDFDIVDETS